MNAGPMALDMALRHAALGYYMAPVTIRRDSGTLKKRPDYHRLAWDEVATTDADQLTTWARQFGPNVGFLVATEPTGLVVIDLDLKGDDGGAVRWWSEQGLPVAHMVVDTPSGGQHHYWRMPAGMAIPNSAGAIAVGVDVRGVGGHVYAPGTRIIGDSEPYRLLDQLVAPHELPELPSEVVKLIPSGRREPRERGPGSSSGAVHDEPWVIRECARQLGLVGGHPPVEGSGFRSVLLGASMVLGRAVSAGICDRDYAEQRLAEEVARCWGRPDAADQEWIATSLDDGEADPWTVIPAPDPLDAASATSVPDAAEDPDGYAIALELSIRKKRLDRDANAALAAEMREPVAVLDLDAFLDAPQVDYLIPGMLWRTGTSRIFGPPGETKSFLALDIALSLATGTPWRDHEQDAVPVHYVMAEGQAVNTTRALAWFHHRGVDRALARGRFRAIPQGVLLTEEGIAEYLEMVRADGPALVVLDTKARMMLGEENSATDSMIMMRAVDAIKVASGGNACLIDHSGLGDASRARGSNSVLGALDTEVRVTFDRTVGIATAEVTRDKAAQEGELWTYKLQRVEGVAGIKPGTPTPAVPVAVDAASTDAAPFRRSGMWHDNDQPAVPVEIAALAGRGADAAKDLFRVLAFNNDPGGLVRGQLLAHLREGPRQHKESTVDAGLALLKNSGVIVAGDTPSRWVLAGRFISA